MRMVLAIVVLVLVGCSSSPSAPGDGVARQVPPERVRSIAEAQVDTAMAALWAHPAVHADIRFDEGADGATVRVEVDTASGRYRAQRGDDDIDPIEAAADPRVARGLAWATDPLAAEQLDWSGPTEALAERAGRYGLEHGHRVAAPGHDTIEVWISRDSGLITDVVLPRDGVTVAFTPLPAALVIAP